MAENKKAMIIIPGLKTKGTFKFKQQKRQRYLTRYNQEGIPRRCGNLQMNWY
jgi:hypothetical protein